MTGALAVGALRKPADMRPLPSPFWSRQLAGLQDTLPYRLWLARQKPQKVALLPTDPWPGNPEHGAEIAEGYLLIGARRFVFNETVWDDPNAALPASVHDFAWIRDLHALGGTQARIVTRKLTEAWLRQHGQRMDATWEPHLCGQRLANWLMHYSFFGSSASDTFCDALHASMIRQMHVLRHRFGALTHDRTRFSVLQGLAFATGCLRGFGDSFEAVLNQLTRELVLQLDEDDAHRSASPQIHFDVLRDLIALRGLCHIRQREVPGALRDAISAMADVVRFLRLGDGSLPLFHGTRSLSRGTVDQVLSLTGTPRTAAGPTLTAMGLHRVTRGAVTVILDAVKPVRATHGHYHASALAFEMSIGKQKLITNCGWPLLPDPVWRDALRSTPAHSGVTVNGMSSATFEDDLFMTQRLTEIQVTREGSVLQAGLEAMHNGYVPPFGVRHRRRLSCDEHGALTGEDIIEGEPGQEIVIRFHLAPYVRAVVEGSKRKAYLDLPNKDIWAIQASSGTIALEDSLCFGENGERIKTVQVVLTGTTEAFATVFKWVIGKV